MAGRGPFAAPPPRRLLVLLAQHVLWVAWGWNAQAHALVALQFALAAMNVRGAKKNEAA